MQGFQPRGSFFEFSFLPIVMVELILKKNSASISIKKYVIRLFTVCCVVRRHPWRDTCGSLLKLKDGISLPSRKRGACDLIYF